MAIGDKIKEIRENFGLTQAELAAKSSVSRVSIGNYERGTRIPNSSVLKKIADALYTSPDFLLGDNPYFNTDDKTSDLYEKYLPDYGYDHHLEDFLEKRGYFIEPSIYDYDNEEEQQLRADEWAEPEKQYFNIIHNGTKVKVTPQEAATFEHNIINAIEYEWYKIKQKYNK